MSQEAQCDFRAGDLVRVRGCRWQIASTDPFDDCHAIRLSGREASNHGTARTVLCPFDRPLAVRPSPGLRVLKRKGWMRALAGLVQASIHHDALHAAATADFDLFAHQLEPALALIRGATRLLIADEVGLGKTIQAGLILAELRARQQAERVLVLTPAGLRQQWSAELSRRFRIPNMVIDAATVEHHVRAFPRGFNPWLLPGVHIASYDFVKQPEVRRALDTIVWDALIVDEAHNVTGATARYRGIRTIAAQSKFVILLTATPHAGDDERFQQLCSLGAEGANGGAGQPILLFRRSRADAGIHESRRVLLLSVRPSEAERRMHGLLARYTRLVWREAARERRGDALVAMTVLKKRAFSSAASLERSLVRRLNWMTSSRPDEALQLVFPFADDDPACEDAEPAGEIVAPGLSDASRERRWLEALIAAARQAAASESKLRRLGRLLGAVREPVIVFTEYRDTLATLAAALQPLSVMVLHGGLTRREREHAEHRFCSGGARVLLATDAASEGLNLQARCRFVVNYELPWNPMRLEQRIGRVDRLGQTRPVRVLNLLARGTPEAGVLARLARRLERVRLALGGTSEVLGRLGTDTLSAAVVTGMPFDEQHAPGEPDMDRSSRARPYVTADLRTAARLELERIAQSRRANVGRSSSPWPPATAIVAIRRHRAFARRSILVICTARIEDGLGRLVETIVVAAVVQASACPGLTTPADFRAHAETFIDPVVRGALRQTRLAVDDRLHVIAAERAPMHESRAARARWIGDALARRWPDRLLQPALFDGRVRRDSERRATTRDELAAARDRMAREIAAGSRLAASELCPAFILVNC
jgi:superfamily II DNA or RNA helicase